MAGILKNGILLGQVIPSTLKNAVKVQVPYFTFDPNLKAYFKKSQDFLVQDQLKTCKTGDVVIISKLDRQEKKEITHKVTDMVFKFGDVRDPVSGQMVVGPEYRHNLTEEAELYGANMDRENFDYKEAKERGRLEGVRDFTDKPTYRKWHAFQKDDPYGIQH